MTETIVNPAYSSSSTSSLCEKKTVLVGWGSTAVFLTSLVALAIIFTLSRAEIFPHFPPTSFYAASLAVSGCAILGLIALILSWRREKTEEPKETVDVPPSLPRSLPKTFPGKPIFPKRKKESSPPEPPIHPPSDPLKKDLSTLPSSTTTQGDTTTPGASAGSGGGGSLPEPNSIDPIAMLLKMSAVENCSLHPAINGSFDFFDAAPSPITTSESALGAFLLLLGDFMGGKQKRVRADSLLALNFLCTQLEVLKKENILELELDPLIEILKNRYRFASYENQLSKPLSPEEYIKGKAALKQKIIEALEQNKTLLLGAGYAAQPSGHVASLELTFHEGKVEGILTNTGDGLRYHTKKVVNSTRYHSLYLQPVSLSELKDSVFLDVYIDLQISQLREQHAKYNVRIDTLYSSNELYDVFLPLWPNGITEHKNTNKKQDGDTCSMSSLIAFIGQNLPKKDKKLVELYLEIQAFDLLIKFCDLEGLDLNRIEDAIAKLNRTAASATEKYTLPESLQLKVTSVTEAAWKKIHAVQKAVIERQRNHVFPHLSRHRDPHDNKITVPCGEQLNSSPAKTEELSDLPPFEIGRAESYFESAIKLINEASDKKQKERAKAIAREAIFEIPNPSDPFWQTSHSNQLMRNLTYLSKFLSEEQLKGKHPPNISATANQGVLYLKVLAISLSQAACHGVPNDVVALYGAQLKGLLKKTAKNYKLTHPQTALLFFDCLNFLSQFEDCPNPIELLPDRREAWLFEKRKFESLEEIRADPELRFLNDFCQFHRDKISFLADSQANSMKDTFKLYRLHLLKYNYRSPDPEVETNKKKGNFWTPFRQWNYLRDLYYTLAVTSFLACEPTNRSISIDFSFSLEQETYYKEVCVDYIKPTDPENLSSGIFQDTFYHLNAELKSHLEQLTDHTPKFLNLPRRTQNEHLLCQREVRLAEDVHISPQEMQCLLSIQTYDELMIPQLIFYFTRYFYRINDQRFQAIFASFLFALNRDESALILQHTMESNSFVKQALFQFFRNALEKTELLGWREAHDFFFHMLAISTRYLVEAQSQTPAAKEAMSFLREKIESALKNETFSLEERAQAYRALIIATPYLDHPDLFPVLNLIKEASEHILSHAAPQPENSLQMAEDYTLGLKALQMKGQPKGMLPQEIVTHEDFFFGKGKNFAAKKVAEGIYDFYDDLGEHYKISLEGCLLKIHKEINHQWYHLKEPDNLTFSEFPADHPITYGYFRQNVRTFLPLRLPGKILIFDKETGKLKCLVKNNQILHPTEPLALASPKALPVANYLKRIAQAKDILVWKNRSNEVVKVEIPDYELTFQFSEGKWMSSKHSGFFLDESTFCPQLEPYTHFLCLRNEKGKRIILVADFGLSPVKQDSAHPMGVYYQHFKSKSSLFTYTLDRKGIIKIPENNDKMLYLIYMAMRKGDYKLARKLVIHIQKLATHWEADWTLWISKLECPDHAHVLDMHPQAIALRIQLRLLMVKLTDQNLRKKEINGLETDYMSYLDSKKHAVGFQLSREEELAAIDLLHEAKNEISPVTAFRITTRSDALKNVVQTDSKSFVFERSPKKGHVRNFSWLTIEIEEKMRESLYAPQQVSLLTRPGSSFIENFLYYYAIARHLEVGNPLFDQLRLLLRTSRGMEDYPLKSLHALLYDVSISPRSFPTIQELLQRPAGELQTTLKDLPAHNYPFPTWSFSDVAGELKTKVMPEPAISQRDAVYFTVQARKKTANDFNFIEIFKKEGTFEKQALEMQKADIEDDISTLMDMKAFFKECQDENPCVNREFKRLIHGIKKKKKGLQKKLEASAIDYQFNTKNIKQTEIRLKELLSDLESPLAQAKSNIFKIAHDYPGGLAFKKEGGIYKPLTLEELIVHFATGNDAAIRSSNPHLTASSERELKEHIADFLLLSTEQNQVLQLLSDLQDIGKAVSHARSPQEVKSTSAAFVKTAMAQRVYDPLEMPHLLVFEYFGKIRLREEQYTTLINMTTCELNKEYEARTGFGKSKVLIPLWLFIKSHLIEEDNRKAPMMTVPPSLFISQQMHLRKVLGKAFDVCICPLQFNRSSGNDPQYLKMLSQQLEDAKENRKILLTTIPSIHGMLSLKLKESLASTGAANSIPLKAQLIELRKKIANDLVHFFDESKVCFNIRQRYDYALGAMQAVEPKHFSTACFIYRHLLVQNPEIQKYQLEFLPFENGQKEKKLIPLQENYEKEILPKIAQQVAVLFKVPERLMKVVLADLQGNYTPDCEEFYNLLSISRLGEYDRIKKQLTNHLSRTLYRKCDDSYGFYPGTRLAIPFTDGVGKKNSEFSEVEDYIDFTIQANLKKPFTIEDLEKFFEPLKLRSQEGELTHCEMKLIEKLCHPIPLLKIRKNEYEKIRDKLNADPLLKLEFIEQAILPQIKIYKSKISSSAFNLIGGLDHLQAASGTVDPDMLPPKITTEEDAGAVIDNLLSLWKNSQEKIITLAEGNAKTQLDVLLSERKKESVLIDVAGTFRDLDEKTLAGIILERRAESLGVLLYDEEGNELIYERATGHIVPRKDSHLTTEQLFIFIRKFKAIGTDTDMSLTAQAIVTADRDTYRDILFQGTGRLRKLAEGQIASFAIANGDQEIIFGEKKRSLRHLIEYSIRVQGKQKGEDAFYILKLYLEDLIDSAFWSAAAHRKTSSLQRLFADLKEILVVDTQTKPLAGLRKRRGKVSAAEAVQHLKNEGFARLEKICAAAKSKDWVKHFNIEELKRKFDAFVDWEKLPKEILLSAAEEGVSTVEAEAVHETDHVAEAAEAELENVTDKITELPKHLFKPSNPVYWDGNYVNAFSAPSATDLLGIPLYYSPNFTFVSELAGDNKQLQKPAYEYLIYVDALGGIKMMLLDLHDAKVVMQRMLSHHIASEKEGYYLILGTNILAQDSYQPPFSFASKEPAIASIHLIRKLFSAQTTLTRKEKKHLARISSEKSKAFADFARNLQILWPHLAPLTAQLQQEV